jgi:predicted Holliday junction resolvase-like endonuclease
MLGLMLTIVLLIIALGYIWMDSERRINFAINEFKENELARQMEKYKNQCDSELQYFKDNASRLALEEAQLKLNQWKEEQEKQIREDAIQRSKNVVAGKISEHFIPYLPEFGWSAKDARFIGAPIDFIVFDGLSEGQLRQIVFVEVKTNTSQLNQRERQIRDIINRGLVKFEELRHMIGEVVKP